MLGHDLQWALVMALQQNYDAIGLRRLLHVQVQVERFVAKFWIMLCNDCQ